MSGISLDGIMVFPPFIALILAVLLRRVPFPEALTSLFSTLAGTLIPLVMIAVGMQLRLRLSRESTLHLVLGLSIKLILIPLAAFLVCKGFGLEGESVRVSIFEAGMPPMITAGALAVSADLSPEPCRRHGRHRHGCQFRTHPTPDISDALTKIPAVTL